MNGGVKQLLVMTSLAAAGCAAAPNGVEIRQIGGAGARLRAADDPLAAAKGQLAIGNVGLALEGFRKAARERPDSAEAQAGMAACYESMGRFDLAEAKYEAALALAPRNVVLLTALAGVLDRLGRSADAAGVRGEVALLNSASAALDRTPADDEPAPVATRPAQTVAVALPPAASVTVALPPPQLPAPAVVAVQGARPADRLRGPGELAASEIAIRAEAPAAADQVTVKLPAPRLADDAGVSLRAVPLPVRSGSLGQQARIDVDLSTDVPPARLADRAAVSLSATALPVSGGGLARHARLNADLSSDVPAPRIEKRAAVDLRAGAAPRLERMSLGEVALLTGSGPVWRGQVVARTPQKLTVRWVPLASAAARPSIRLLNAARWQGLAARSRSYLVDRGWRRIQIGDARQTRDQSLVLYPAAHAAIGRRLAAQFGCRSRAVQGSNVFLVLLGRDSRLRAAPQRG